MVVGEQFLRVNGSLAVAAPELAEEYRAAGDVLYGDVGLAAAGCSERYPCSPAPPELYRLPPQWQQTGMRYWRDPPRQFALHFAQARRIVDIKRLTACKTRIVAALPSLIAGSSRKQRRNFAPKQIALCYQNFKSMDYQFQLDLPKDTDIRPMSSVNFAEERSATRGQVTGSGIRGRRTTGRKTRRREANGAGESVSGACGPRPSPPALPAPLPWPSPPGPRRPSRCRPPRASARNRVRGTPGTAAARPSPAGA